MRANASLNLIADRSAGGTASEQQNMMLHSNPYPKRRKVCDGRLTPKPTPSHGGVGAKKCSIGSDAISASALVVTI